MAKRRSRLTIRSTRAKRTGTRSRGAAAAVKAARRRSALRGWETRHANQAKRSAIAKKGWKTRRRNAKHPTRKPRTSADLPRTREPRTPPRSRGGVGPARSEYIGAADYSARRKSSSVSVQISATGPVGASSAEAKAAIEEKISTGRSPRGWNVRLMDWSDPGAWKKLNEVLKRSRVSVE